jgi:hypothetical protein
MKIARYIHPIYKILQGIHKLRVLPIRQIQPLLVLELDV